jgi:DNA polymerase III subunit epsilon
MPLLRETQFVCFDCEMTGLDPTKDQIIEIAALRFTFNEVRGEFEALINPECPISEEAFAIHHISNEMVREKPKIEEILPSFIQFIGTDIVVGHGFAYDLVMLNRAAQRMLDRLASHFNIQREEAHRAMHDVRMNIAVFWHLVRRYKTVEEIFQVLAHPIKMKYMPLGKYKGRLFSEIPLSYLQHAAHLDYDQDLLYSIRSELKKRKEGGSFTAATNPFAKL